MANLIVHFVVARTRPKDDGDRRVLKRNLNFLLPQFPRAGCV